jgi:hypothetical protein
MYVIALQRLYVFWPDLEVRINTMGDMGEGGDDDGFESVATMPGVHTQDASSSSSSSSQKCQVSLLWPDRTHVSKAFRDPDLFEPNVNLI